MFEFWSSTSLFCRAYFYQMNTRCLRDVREAITFTYANDLIDDVEFALLYDVNSSKDVFPHWKFKDFNFEDWDNVECKTELRFAKADVLRLVHHLQLPEKIVCSQGTVCIVDWKDFVFC